MHKIIFSLVLLVFLLPVTFSAYAGGGGAGGLNNNFTKLELILHEDSIDTSEDLNNLEPGLYEFRVKNETSEKVEFVIQDLKTSKQLAKLKIKPNKTKKSRVKITENGFKYQKSNGNWHEFAVN